MGCTVAHHQPDPPKQVVVIFRDAPNQSTSRVLDGLSRGPEGTLTYVDTLLRRNYYVPRTIGYDTLVIPAPYGYAEAYHRNQAVDEIPYLFLAGDTVLFTYEDRTLRPRLRSLTSEENTRLYNLMWNDPRAVQPNGYSTATVLTNDHFILADKALKNRTTNYPESILAKIRRYSIDLDSLRPVYEAYRSEMLDRLDSLEKARSIPGVYADYYRRYVLSDPFERDELPASDSLMQYISNNEKVMTYPSRISPGGKSTEQFDLIANDTVLPSSARLALLYDLMSRIERGGWRPYPEEVVAHYRTRYREITGDSTTFHPVMVNKENLLPAGYSNDLLLERTDGVQTAFEHVLRRHRGKVIYVDLWASWCAPCRGGMPAALKLREHYRDKEVVFLYLAVNDTRDAWRSAVKSCRTDYLGENYRVLNSSDARFLLEIKNTKIPQMLLYDRTGKLVDTDAPRPEDERIKKEIDRLLN